MKSSNITWKGYVLLVFALLIGIIVSCIVIPAANGAEAMVLNCEVPTGTSQGQEEVEPPSLEERFPGAIILKPAPYDPSVRSPATLPPFMERKEVHEEWNEYWHPNMMPAIQPEEKPRGALRKVFRWFLGFFNNV